MGQGRVLGVRPSSFAGSGMGDAVVEAFVDSSIVAGGKQGRDEDGAERIYYITTMGRK